MIDRPALDWKIGGLALGVVFFLAVALVKPVGVSTEFVVLDGIIWDAVDASVVTESGDGLASTNAYLGKYVESVADPLNYSFIFVLALAAGAGISSALRRGVTGAERTMPAIWRANMGDGVLRRYAVAFLGGFVVLYGARLAGGCTSGHMMSGMMQTALSGYIFAAGAFMAAIPTAVWLYQREA